jgi:hypothetical protein
LLRLAEPRSGGWVSAFGCGSAALCLVIGFFFSVVVKILNPAQKPAFTKYYFL